LADKVPVEIVSADSRQVYRYMDIGTAKPTVEERSRAPHHMLDVVDPDEQYTLAQYQESAYRAINGVLRRGSLPLLVGGSGLYVRAVLEGMVIPAVGPNQELRERLHAEAGRDGPEALHGRLRQLDPSTAARIDPRNVRRVIRAIEVCIELKQPMSRVQQKEPPPYCVLCLGLTMDRPQLYERVDKRIDSMLSAGLVDEVEGLLSKGYGYELPAMSGLGYRQIGMYLRGEIDLTQAVALMRRHTRRFVRQQYNWFRLSDRSIHWLVPSRESVDQAYQQIRALLQGTANRVAE
jgi:tRNA dimethylallyltransferase